MRDLFFQMAGATGIKAGTQTDLEAIPKILAWLQGHPLALKLVIPLAKKRGIQRVWADLQRQPLKGIDAVFEVSCARLDPLELRLFARLSVFTIAFEWEAVTALMPGEVDVDEALDCLVQRALISFDGGRYSYHSLTRQYAFSILKRGEDVAPIHKLAAEYFIAKGRTGLLPIEVLEAADQLELAQEWEEFARFTRTLIDTLAPIGYWNEIELRLSRALSAVREHLPSIRALEVEILVDLGAIADKRARWDDARRAWEEALRLCHACGLDKDAPGVCNNLALLHEARGEYREAERLLIDVLRVQDSLDCARCAETIYNLALVNMHMGNWDSALNYYRRALEIDETSGNQQGMAMCYNGLGLVLAETRAWDQAADYYLKAVTIQKNIRDLHALSLTYNNLGILYRHQGKTELAAESYTESLAIKEYLNDLYGQAGTYVNLGTIYSEAAKWSLAIECYRKALGVLESLGDLRGCGEAIHNLGIVYAQTGEVAKAQEHLERAQRLFERMVDSRGVIGCMVDRGNLHSEIGESALAEALYRRAAELAVSNGDLEAQARAYNGLGALAIASGNSEAARPLCERSLEAAKEVFDLGSQASAMVNLGILAMVEHDYRQANAWLVQSLELQEMLGDVLQVAQIRANLGVVQQGLGNLELAAEYSASAYAIFDEIGAKEKALICVNALSQRLGSSQAAQAYLAARMGSAAPCLMEYGDVVYTIEWLLSQVVHARQSGGQEAARWFDVVRHMWGSSTQPAEIQSLDKILMHYLLGDRELDLSSLTPQIAREVREALCTPEEN